MSGKIELMYDEFLYSLIQCAVTDRQRYANEIFTKFCIETENEEVKKCFHTRRIRGSDTPAPVVRSFYQYLLRTQEPNKIFRRTKGKKKELFAISNILGTLPSAFTSQWNKFIESTDFGFGQGQDNDNRSDSGESEGSLDSPSENNKFEDQQPILIEKRIKENGGSVSLLLSEKESIIHPPQLRHNEIFLTGSDSDNEDFRKEKRHKADNREQ